MSAREVTPITSAAVDADDGLEEDEPLFPWLPPDDRLWRHPSEMARSPDATVPSDTPGDAGSRPDTIPPDPSVTRRLPVGPPSPAGASFTTRSGTATLLAGRELDRRLWAVALLAGVVGALLASGAGVVAGQYHHSTVVRPVEQVVQANPYVTIATNPKTYDIVDIAARLRPTIVELLVNSNGANGSGSGVIFTGDGYILTNDHVVEGAQSVVAVMSDGRRITCRLIGTDKATDIAVVKLQDSKPQSVAILGSSTQLKVGQLAIAIGSPLGLAGGPSVTSGIISAVDRQVSPGSGPPLVDMIQTDANLDPGSSGGALVDASGMVIGITTAVALSDQSTQTLGFATPIEVARDVANQILSTGKVSHAWLGVEGADVDVSAAKTLGISGGAVVQSVDNHSPASRIGIGPADVVTAFAGQPVDSMSTLEMSVRQHRPGDRVTITWLRGGDTHTTDVLLQERPAPDWP
jgi:putative serine protease PepD